MVNLGPAGWKHNWGKSGSAGSGGQGRRNFYMGTPTGPVETTQEESTQHTASFNPVFSPFDPNQIKRVSVGDILEKTLSDDPTL